MFQNFIRFSFSSIEKRRTKDKQDNKTDRLKDRQKQIEEGHTVKNKKGHTYKKKKRNKDSWTKRNKDCWQEGKNRHTKKN